MKTVQIVLDEATLRATDRAARQSRKNRSEVVREALRDYLATRAVRASERADRAGYERAPQHRDELADWDVLQSWPED